MHVELVNDGESLLAERTNVTQRIIHAVFIRSADDRIRQPLVAQVLSHGSDDALLIGRREVTALLRAVRLPPIGVGLVQRLQRTKVDAVLVVVVSYQDRM